MALTTYRQRQSMKRNARAMQRQIRRSAKELRRQVGRNYRVTVKGLKAVRRKTRRLVREAHKEMTKTAALKLTERVREYVYQKLSGESVQVVTGALRTAYLKIRGKWAVRRKSRGFYVWAIQGPTRAKLGISPDDKYYYPHAIEYGHVRAMAHPFIRPAIDENKGRLRSMFVRMFAEWVKKRAKRKDSDR